jgi:hypothetical protein
MTNNFSHLVNGGLDLQGQEGLTAVLDGVFMGEIIGRMAFSWRQASCLKAWGFCRLMQCVRDRESRVQHVCGQKSKTYHPCTFRVCGTKAPGTVLVSGLGTSRVRMHACQALVVCSKDHAYERALQQPLNIMSMPILETITVVTQTAITRLAAKQTIDDF